MRLIFLFIFFLTSVIFLNAQKRGMSIFNQFKTFEIIGKINGYVPQNNNGFVTVRTYSFAQRLKDTAIVISRSGEFHCQLYQQFEGDAAFMYNGEYATIYVKPGEKILMEIEESQWKKEENKSRAIRLSGESAALSKYILDFTFQLSKKAFINNPTLKDKKQKDEEFAKTAIARIKEELAFLDAYCAKNKVKNPLFQQWCSNNIIYTNGSNILLFPFFGKLNSSITYDQLIAYLAPIAIGNGKALHNSSYYEFLRHLSTGFKIIGNLNNLYTDSIKSNGNSTLLFNFKHIDAYASGIIRQILYFYFFDNRENDCKKFMSIYNSVVREPTLKRLLMEQSKEKQAFVPFNVVDKMRKHPQSDSLTQWLSAFLKENSDKYILVDFWGSWCGPCMLEMKQYPALIATLKEKPIVYLFLAVETTEEKMREVKEKYRIDGQFVSLSENDTKVFNNVLQFSSYPHHLLIDPKGNLIKNDISNITSGSQFNKDVTKQIELAISKINNTATNSALPK